MTRRSLLGLSMLGMGALVASGHIRLLDADTTVLEPKPDDATLRYLLENMDGSIIDTSPVRILGAVGTKGGIDVLVSDYPLHVKLSFADASLVREDDDIDTFWAREDASGWLCMHDIYLPLYDVGDPTYYVGLAMQQAAVSDDLRAQAVQFAYDHDWAETIDTCVYDENTGIAYVPKDLFDGEELHGAIQAQIMVATNFEGGLPDIAVPVTIDDGQVWEGTLICNVADPVMAIDLSQANVRITDPKVVHVSYMGCGKRFSVDEDLVRMSEDGLTIYVLMAPVCISGIHIDIDSPKPLANLFGARVAWALTGTADDMNTYPYGYMHYDPNIVEGYSFTYDGWACYPNRRLRPDWVDLVMPAYELLYSSSYWWAAQQNEPGQPLYNAGDATLHTFDEIKNQIVSGPHGWQLKNGDPGITNYDGGVWVDLMGDEGQQATPDWTGAYWGQMITLPGSVHSSNHSFHDDAWWQSLYESWPANYPKERGWVTAYCNHVSVATTTTDDNIYRYASQIVAKVLRVGKTVVTGQYRRYYVIAFTTKEVAQTGTWAIDRQGSTVIYKFAVEPLTVGLRVKKVISKRTESDVIDTNKQFTFTLTVRDVDNNLVSGTYGNHTFTDGTCRFTLRHDQTETFENMPEGWHYYLEEQDTPNYECETPSIDFDIDANANGGWKDVTVRNSATSGYLRLEKELEI